MTKIYPQSTPVKHYLYPPCGGHRELKIVYKNSINIFRHLNRQNH